MGKLIDGIWQEETDFGSNEEGEFQRAETKFRHQISADPNADYPAVRNRYHLYISYACPWASRTLIMYELKNLKDVISISTTDAYMGKDGWSFGKSSNETTDQVMHAEYLRDIYVRADPSFTGRVTVPVLWDKKTNTIVNNESSDIMRILNSQFDAYTNNHDDFYPEHLQKEIDHINQYIYENINNGVYKCGFAQNQHAYDDAFNNLFLALESMEQRLSQNRYLLGNEITESDWRLFTTLIRFDVVYYVHFKCNKKLIKDSPNLFNYLLELYQYPGIKNTVRFDHIKEHYYLSHPMLNPKGIIPNGPDIDLTRRHNRDKIVSAR